MEVKSLGTFVSLIIVSIFITNLSCAQTINFSTSSAKFTEKMIRDESAMYPAAILQNYLKEIIIEDGEGFCGRAEVFSNRIVLNGTCDELKKVVHHEISSLFLHLFDGNGKPTYNAPILDTLYGSFLKLNGDYRYSYANDIYANNLIEPILADRFYLLKYASRDFENDVNVIAQYLFTEGSAIIDFVETYPDKPVSKKIELVVRLYQSVDPLFDKNFFRSRS